MLQSAYSQEPDAEAIEGYLRPMLVRGTTTAILSSALAKSNFDLDYKSVANKMLVVWGEKDMWIAPSIAQNWHKNFPEVPLIIIKNAGHCPMETHSEEFNEALEKYLP